MAKVLVLSKDRRELTLIERLLEKEVWVHVFVMWAGR